MQNTHSKCTYIIEQYKLIHKLTKAGNKIKMRNKIKNKINFAEIHARDVIETWRRPERRTPINVFKLIICMSESRFKNYTILKNIIY